MIRDRLVVGLLDARLSEKLQLKDSLTLDTAVKEARQTEAVKGQQATIRPAETQPAAVAAVRAGGKTHRKTNGAKTQSNGPRRDRDRDREATSSSPDPNSCTCNWCGNQPHDRSRCPARNATCLSSSTRGSGGRRRRGLLPRSRPQRPVSMDKVSLFTWHTLNDDYRHRCRRNCNLRIGLRLSTAPHTSTHSITHILKGPDGRPLDVVGCFNTTLSLYSLC